VSQNALNWPNNEDFPVFAFDYFAKRFLCRWKRLSPFSARGGSVVSGKYSSFMATHG
jgi:hypothetical protein